MDEVGGKWEILSHPTGRWVINAGGNRLAMPEVPARWLLSLHGRRPCLEDVLACLRRGNQADKAGWSEEKIHGAAVGLTNYREDSQPRQSRRALWLRVPLISASWTKRLARPLEVLTGARVLTGLAVLGLVGPLLLAKESSSTLPTGGDWLPAMALFFMGAMLHELAHAAALSSQGYPAGGVGAGLLFVIPVLYNDVSAISLLSKSGKLRVDLAGVAVQVAFGTLLIMGANSPGPHRSELLLAAKMTHLAVGWSLIPFIRADGYWALCDALGLPDLDRALSAPVSRPRVLFMLVHRVLNVVFLIFVAVVLPLTWTGRLTAVLPAAAQTVSSVIFPCVILLIWWAMAMRIKGLVSALVSDFRLLKK